MEQSGDGVHSLILNKLSTPVLPLAGLPTFDRGRYVDLKYMRSVAKKSKYAVTRTYSDPTTHIAKLLIKQTILENDAARQQVELSNLELKQPPKRPGNDSKPSTTPPSSSPVSTPPPPSLIRNEKIPVTSPTASNDYASGDESSSNKPKLRRSSGKRKPDTFQNLLRYSADDVVDSFTGEKVGLSIDSLTGEDLALKDRKREHLNMRNKLPIWESTSLTFALTPSEGNSRENLADGKITRGKKPKSILVRKRLKRSLSYPELIHHNTSKGVKFALTSCNFVSCPSHVFPTEPYAVAFDMPFEDSDDELIEYPKPPTRSPESLGLDDDVISTQPKAQGELLRELDGDVSSPPNGARYVIVDSEPEYCMDCIRLSKAAVKCCTCVFCVQAACYHCAKDDVGDRDWVDNFGSCRGSREQNYKRWGAFGALSLLLPCLMFYPPLMGALNACLRCQKRKTINDNDDNITCNKHT